MKPRKAEVYTLERKKLQAVNVSHGSHAAHVIVATFNRPLSSEELRYFEEVLQRAAACSPID